MVGQTGSGTQSNMNANEVIASRANEILTGKKGGKGSGPSQRPLQHGPVVERHLPHRDDIAAAHEAITHLIPGADPKLHGALDAKAQGFADVVKIGRTHFAGCHPDGRWGRNYPATPGRSNMASPALEATLPRVLELAQGGTGSRHRDNSKVGLQEFASQVRPPKPATPFVTAPNKVRALAAHLMRWSRFPAR